MNFLDKIISSRRDSVSEAQKVLPLDKVKSLASGKRPSRNFGQALARLPGESVKVIAEIKRSSPSKGIIASDIEPASVAKEYEAGKVSAISILTEPSYFNGTSEDLRSVRSAVPGLPLLRKDFIVDEYQVYESVLLGADALLLIVAALSLSDLKRLKSVADDCGIDSLVEVHSEKELDSAMAIGAEIIGVNNRDLTSFEVSPEVSEKLSRIIPRDIVSVSESGIDRVAGLEAAAALGYHAALIGEHFMRAKDRVAEVRRFTSFGLTHIAKPADRTGRRMADG